MDAILRREREVDAAKIGTRWNDKYIARRRKAVELCELVATTTMRPSAS